MRFLGCGLERDTGVLETAMVLHSAGGPKPLTRSNDHGSKPLNS